MLAYLATGALESGVDPAPVGSGHHTIVPYRAYACRDGWIVITVISIVLGVRQASKIRSEGDVKSGGKRAPMVFLLLITVMTIRTITIGLNT